MDWITEQVVIGNRLDARHAGTCQKTGFRAVQSLDGSPPVLVHGNRMSSPKEYSHV